jgi:DNA-binding NtrC family response regulator
MPPPVEARPHGFVGNTRAVQLLFDRVERFAPNDAPVLITGESGTGKELIARALHHQSPRASGPFVTVNCAAFPETLLEAELFGHERGAFTGAVHRREGRFQAANNGTLFLDEVAEMPLAAQVKLLRFLQEGVFEPLGSNRSIQVKVRVVSATHRDLRALVEQARFRDDLYYRLNVLELSIPPLRARPEDLPLLVRHFLAHYGGARPAEITDQAFTALQHYQYPGNVRELEHVLQQAIVLADGGPVDLVHLPAEFSGTSALSMPLRVDAPLMPLSEAMFEFEGAYLRRALIEAGGVKWRAGRALGISRKCLWQKLQRHGIVARSRPSLIERVGEGDSFDREKRRA